MKLSEGRKRYLIGAAVSFALIVSFGLAWGLLKADASTQFICQRSSTQQETQASCYGDRSWPTPVHVRHIRHGDYGHAPRHIHYGPRLKRIIVRKVLRKWPERWGAKNRPKAWHKVIDHDTCYAPPSKYSMSCGGAGTGGRAICPKNDPCRRRTHVIACGAIAVATWPAESLTAGVLMGSGCAVDFLLGR